MNYLELSQKLEYDKDTGQISWKSEEGARYKGKLAGCIHDKTIGYLKVKHNKKRYMAHKLAWTIHYGKEPKSSLDHIDGDKTNNRIKNLREVTPSENMRNQTNRQSKYGTPGLTKTRGGKWRVLICGERVGVFNTVEEAAEARMLAEQRLGGFTETHCRLVS